MAIYSESPEPQHDSPSCESAESPEKDGKDVAGLTRRGVLKVAWTVPVILAINPPVNPRAVLAQSAPHGDAPHNDAPL